MKETLLKREGIRRVLCMVLCLVMCLSLLPTMAFAADVETYNVWVDGDQFTSNTLTIPCGPGTATYDPETNTVTLNGVQIMNECNTGAIRANGALTVNVASDSSITLDSSTHAHGIFTNGNLTLTGSGNLDIRVEGDYDGLETIAGNVTIAGSGNVTVNAGAHGVYSGNGNLILSGSGNVDIYGKWDGAYGENIKMLLNGTGSSITLRGGYIALHNDDDDESIVAGSNLDDYEVIGSPDSTSVVYALKALSTPYDVWANGEQFTSNKLTITCGTGTATYDPDANTVTLDGAQITKATDKGAIYADKALTVNVVGDSSIHLDSDTKTIGGIYADTLVLNASNNLDICVDNKDSGGIYTNGRDVRFPDSGDVTINGDGDVTISAGDNGISSTGSVTFSGSGDVTIAARSNGIYCYDNVTINGSGNVNIASQYSYGVFEYGDVTISNSANVKIKGFYSGVYIGKVGESGRSLILSGSGKVDIGGTQRGVTLCGDGKVFLNGTGSLIKLHAGTASLAVYNGDTKESPVVGANIDKYDVTGDPASASVAYTWKGNSYNVWIGDVQVTDANKDNVLGDGTVSCDPVTNTVTLDGAQITKASKAGAIYAENALTVKVIGDSSITLDSNTCTQGIYAMGDLVLTGPGNLEISVESEHNGIEVWGDVTISGSGDVTVNAGEFGIFIVEDSMGSLILSGSGKVDIYGKCDGVLFWDDDSAVLLNGTCSSITLHAGEEYKAVCNGNTQESPVAGSNLDNYEVIGSPDSASVIYCKHENIDIKNAVSPTCTAEGYTGDVCCKDCGKMISKGTIIEKTAHTYKYDIHAPTCTEDGYQIITCKNCDYTLTVFAGSAYGHQEEPIPGKAATCTETGLTEGKKCVICDEILEAQTVVPAKGHTYKATTTKATLSANGKVVNKCSVCGKTTTKTVYMPKTFSLSYTKTTYNGKVKAPTVTVKDSKGNVLKKGTDYTVTYASGRKAVGSYKVTIKGIGKYSFTKTLTFKINPAATKIVSATNVVTKSIKVKWNKAAGAGGYQVKYVKGSTTKTVTVKGASTLTKTLSKLTKGSTYKIYVRSYKTVNSTNYYSAWSAYKSVKVAK